jgi:glucose-1-phosphate thymidylyltransferase
MKGIILAGGFGTRLHPITIPTSKQLLPIYDKPMIYYPLCNLMQAGIKDILIITTKDSLYQYSRLLGDGNQWGMTIEYLIQDHPNGIAEAFIIGKEFIGQESCALILGDNLFHGKNLSQLIKQAKRRDTGATIFACLVSDPERFGVITFNKDNRIESLEEKPKSPKSNFVVPGFYFYDNKVVDYAANIKPSPRGELEIQDINNQYLQNEELFVEVFDEDIDWIDAGTFDSLLEASSYIQAEESINYKIGCPEETAWLNGWIDDKQLYVIAKTLEKNSYGQHLLKILKID